MSERWSERDALSDVRVVDAEQAAPVKAWSVSSSSSIVPFDRAMRGHWHGFGTATGRSLMDEHSGEFRATGFLP